LCLFLLFRLGKTPTSFFSAIEKKDMQQQQQASVKGIVKAIAVFHGKVKGTVRFQEDFATKSVLISIDLEGLKKNSLQGFHVHERGDMSSSCESMCAHFNPYGRQHGCPGMKERHVGDLGNLQTDAQGRARYIMRDNVIQLRGSKANIIGRGLVIHADPDDCGQGENEASAINGNAGKRIACAVIGIA
jgi:Cu-Zn family superoxide dismutase